MRLAISICMGVVGLVLLFMAGCYSIEDNYSRATFDLLLAYANLYGAKMVLEP